MEADCLLYARDWRLREWEGDKETRLSRWFQAEQSCGRPPGEIVFIALGCRGKPLPWVTAKLPSASRRSPAKTPTAQQPSWGNWNLTLARFLAVGFVAMG